MNTHINHWVPLSFLNIRWIFNLRHISLSFLYTLNKQNMVLFMSQLASSHYLNGSQCSTNAPVLSSTNRDRLLALTANNVRRAQMFILKVMFKYWFYFIFPLPSLPTLGSGKVPVHHEVFLLEPGMLSVS